MKRKYIIYVFGIATLIFVNLSTLSFSQVKKDVLEPKHHSDKILLATASYQENRSIRHLSIYRKDTILGLSPSAEEFEQRRQYLKQHPEFEAGENPHTFTNRIGDKVYFLTNESSILGIVYGADYGIPMTLWSFDTVWHSGQKRPYYALSRSNMDSFTLTIFNPDPNEVSSKIPADIDAIHFDKIKFHTWPKPIKPLSELKTNIPNPDLCGINQIKVLPEPNYLLISMHKEHADCDPIYVRFDLDTKEWFWLTMEAKPIEPFN